LAAEIIPKLFGQLILRHPLLRDRLVHAQSLIGDLLRGIAPEVATQIKSMAPTTPVIILTGFGKLMEAAEEKP
jgi:hypothetical protein